MQRLNFSVIWDRRHISTSKRSASVELRFTYGKQTKYLSTGVRVNKGQWNARTQQVTKRDDAKYLNAIIDGYIKRAVSVINDMTASGKVDFDNIGRLMKCDVSASDNFIDYCEKRAVARNVGDSTKERYYVFLRFLRKWGKIKTFSDISVQTVKRMDEFLHSSGKMESTRYSYHKYLKLFINDACIDGMVKKNPYDILPFKVGRGEKQFVDCLTQEQFDALRSLDITTPHLAKARDLFLMQCYTGLAYSDLMAFDFNNCTTNADGKYFYHARRVKTDTDFIFQLLPPAVAIVKGYGYELPQLTNQKYNDYLKVIGLMIGIERLHSHMGRATAATLFLSKGMPINIVAKVLGHTSLRQTQRYARTLSKDVKGAFDKLEGAF